MTLINIEILNENSTKQFCINNAFFENWKEVAHIVVVGKFEERPLPSSGTIQAGKKTTTNIFSKEKV